MNNIDELIGRLLDTTAAGEHGKLHDEAAHTIVKLYEELAEADASYALLQNKYDDREIEIGKLRDELESLYDERHLFVKKHEEAQAELAKLKEALKAIAVDGATGPSCVATARAALGEKP